MRFGSKHNTILMGVIYMSKEIQSLTPEGIFAAWAQATEKAETEYNMCADK